MKRIFLPLSGLSALLFAVAVVGCSQSPDPAATASTNSATPSEEHSAHSDHDHGSMADMEKGLSELSETDRAAAMKQHVCPVTGEMLGTMGKPIKVTVKDQDVWVCCSGCTKQLKEDPDKYLAKLQDHNGDEDQSDHKEHVDDSDGT